MQDRIPPLQVSQSAQDAIAIMQATKELISSGTGTANGKDPRVSLKQGDRIRLPSGQETTVAYFGMTATFPYEIGVCGDNSDGTYHPLSKIEIP